MATQSTSKRSYPFNRDAFVHKFDLFRRKNPGKPSVQATWNFIVQVQDQIKPFLFYAFPAVRSHKFAVDLNDYLYFAKIGLFEAIQHFRPQSPPQPIIATWRLWTRKYLTKEPRQVPGGFSIPALTMKNYLLTRSALSQGNSIPYKNKKTKEFCITMENYKYIESILDRKVSLQEVFSSEFSSRIVPKEYEPPPMDFSQALSELPEKHQYILDLYINKNMSYSKIAKTLNVSRQAICHRKNAAFEILRARPEVQDYYRYFKG